MTKYRIVLKEQQGYTVYVPEKRYLYFFWKEIVKLGCDYITESFVRQEHAEAFIENLINEEPGFKTKVIKKY